MVCIPNPPLRYWPNPPSNEGLLDSDLSISQTDHDDAVLLAQRHEELRELQQRVATHYGQVVQWTELCHAESELHPVSVEQEWLDFVLKIKHYLTHHVAKRNNDIEQAIARINVLQLSVIRRGLLARLERLEQEHDRVQAKRFRLARAESEQDTKGTDVDGNRLIFKPA